MFQKIFIYKDVILLLFFFSNKLYAISCKTLNNFRAYHSIHIIVLTRMLFFNNNYE